MEKEIIHTALNNFHQMEIDAHWKNEGPLDGSLNLIINGRDIPFTAEIKRELRNHQLHQIEIYKQEYQNLIVIAEQIFPKIKEELRKMGVAYMEANGNVFIKTPEIYYFIDTHKKGLQRKEKANRAFTKTGLKVIFHLLQDKNLVNMTQRDIAEITSVGLGNIPQVINGLKDTGYLIRLNKKEYVWENRKELLDRWINEYATELRPKLTKENYALQNDWQGIALNRDLSVWGGEPAADLLTNYLRPEKFIIYTKENKVNLIKKYKFLPKKNGELEVLEMFWNNTEQKETAPPLLIYAELILTGGKRNIETANKIFDEFIQPDL